VSRIKSTALEKIEDTITGLSSKKINRKDYNTIVIEPICAMFTEEEIENYF